MLALEVVSHLSAAGLSQRAIASTLGIARTAVARIWNAQDERGLSDARISEATFRRIQEVATVVPEPRRVEADGRPGMVLASELREHVLAREVQRADE